VAAYQFACRLFFGKLHTNT